MTEVVPELEESAGRSRVQIALIKAAVPVLIAVVGVVTHVVQDQPVGAVTAVDGGAAAAPADAVAPLPLPSLETPPPERWTITGTVGAQAGRDLEGVPLRLYPIEDLVPNYEKSTDSLGEYTFRDVQPAVYALYYKAAEGWTMVTVQKKTALLREDLDFPAPLKLTIIVNEGV
jgi:hypothetical protein